MLDGEDGGLAGMPGESHQEGIAGAYYCHAGEEDAEDACCEGGDADGPEAAEGYAGRGLLGEGGGGAGFGDPGGRAADVADRERVDGGADSGVPRIAADGSDWGCEDLDGPDGTAARIAARGRLAQLVRALL